MLLDATEDKLHTIADANKYFIETYFKDNLINVIGGCCGTNPAHIKSIFEASQNYEPRQLKHQQ